MFNVDLLGFLALILF